jgi:hypothetical protein
MNTIDLIPEDNASDIPQWQKDEVRRRIEKYKNCPEQLIDEDSFFKMLDEE